MDWISCNNSLFVFHEFQKFDSKYGLEIIRMMINNLEINTQSATKIVMTLEDEKELIDALNTIVNPTQYKTKAQVVESNLQIIAV